MRKRTLNGAWRIALLIITAILVFSYPLIANADDKDNGKVRFVVYCQDAQGHTLADAYTFYGAVGEKPQVECPEFAGYQPQAEKITKTLSSDEDENVFTFVYHSLVKEPEKTVSESTSESGGQNTAQETSGETISDGDVPLAATGTAQSKAGSEKGDTHEGYQLWKLLDLDTDEPLASPGKPAEGASVKSGSSTVTLIIAGSVLIIAGLFFILRHNKKKEKQ